MTSCDLKFSKATTAGENWESRLRNKLAYGRDCSYQSDHVHSEMLTCRLCSALLLSVYFHTQLTDLLKTQEHTGVLDPCGGYTWILIWAIQPGTNQTVLRLVRNPEAQIKDCRLHPVVACCSTLCCDVWNCSSHLCHPLNKRGNKKGIKKMISLVLLHRFTSFFLNCPQWVWQCYRNAMVNQWSTLLNHRIKGIIIKESLARHK